MQIVELSNGVKASTGLRWNNVNYFSTWRINGSSKEPYASLNFGLHVGDDEATVIKNRLLLKPSLPAKPVWINQVHGNTVHTVTANNGSVPTADAMVTTMKNVPLAIMTADCLPIVVASLDASVLAVAHAGWRGLVAGVLENTVKTMFDLVGPKAIQAWIGPAIAADVFQVGAEVRTQFLSVDPELDKFFIAQTNIKNDSTQRYLADLPGIANHKLLKLGAMLVENSAECTYKKKERYFSYRRDGQTGRQATIAWLT